VGNLPKALNTYRESLDHRLKVGETNGIAFSHINLATVYAKLKQPDSALYYCLIAETEFKKANNQQTAGWISWIRGYSFLQKNETERAINELKKIEQFNAHFLPGVLLLSDIYEKKKDFRQAFEYQKKWINENKIREEQSNVRAMREIAADYEYKIKQAELIRKEEVERLKKKRIDNLQLMLIAIGLIGSFIFVLSVRKNFSERTVNVLFFVGFMFLFEFVVLLIDPALQNLSGNKPVFLLLGNTLVALLLAPLHGFVERYFKKKIKPDSIEII